ncbi:hypothetical protein [Spirillospora sp. NPDC029432]|uniref:hypothetical protein n=1 Tax=Spirillospora sp. NPDC029432 TaxID=3154599 RepID=UPI0034515A85
MLGRVWAMGVLRRILIGTGGRQETGPFERMTPRALTKGAKEAMADLRARLDAGVPDGPARAQAVTCLETADTVLREFVHRGKNVYYGGWGEYFLVIVLCRTGRTALETGVPVDGTAPYCWHDPLHGQAAGSLELEMDGEARPRPLCGDCLEEARAEKAPRERVLRLPYINGGWTTYLGSTYFDERRGLDHLLRRVEERRRAR